MSFQNDPFLKYYRSIKNEQIDKWQSHNKKVLGYYCAYIPEEILFAGGLLPIRIRGTESPNTDLADVYMVRFTCSFVRSTLNLALKGMYDFLDGVLVFNACDHSRRMFDLFQLEIFKRERYERDGKCFYYSMPHLITEKGFDWYYREIRELKTQIENQFNLPKITHDELIRSVKTHNENRKYLRKIQELRVQESPKLTGTEMLKILIANTSVPKDFANRNLKRIIESLKNRKSISLESKKRLMIVGSVLDNIQLTDIIERSGGFVASDFLCFGSKYYLNDVSLQGDNLLRNIVEKSYYNLSCPRMMDDHHNRFEFIQKQITDAKIDGLILQKINNCDLHGCDNMLFAHELKRKGISVLTLDRESYQADEGRLKTRLEAFIEMLK